MDVPSEWTFKDDAVASEFDQHVREQLPWYGIATRAVGVIGRHYITTNGTVYDIGASTGNIGQELEGTLSNREANLIAIEESEEMASRYVGPGSVEVAKAQDVQYEPFDLAVCFLVLMFMRPRDVASFLDHLISKRMPDGAIVVVDKLMPSGGYASTVMSRITLSAKRDAGVPLGEIAEKELSLSGVQRPISERLLLDRGAWCWFRFGDFAGFVLEGP